MIPAYHVSRGCMETLKAAVVIAVCVMYILTFETLYVRVKKLSITHGGQQQQLAVFQSKDVAKAWYDRRPVAFLGKPARPVPAKGRVLEPCAMPVKKLIYAKTHKTGSTTLQNIVMRFGVRNNLNFAFPPEGRHIYKPPSKYINVVHLMDTGENVTYDVHAFHGRWNLPELGKIIPDGTRFTILRDPVDCFESLYHYYGLRVKYGNATVGDFAIRYAANGVNRTVNERQGKNNQLFDLGVSAAAMEDPEMVARAVRRLDSDFDLVLILERFDESLVLLRDLLCWTTDDVAYAIKNRSGRRATKETALNATTRDVLRKWQWAEYALYEHFKGRLDEKLAAYGEVRLAGELARLRMASERIKKRCDVDKEDIDDMDADYEDYEDEKRASNRSLSAEATTGSVECDMFHLSEIPAVRVLRRWQAKRLNQTLVPYGNLDDDDYADRPPDQEDYPMLDEEAMK